MSQLRWVAAGVVAASAVSLFAAPVAHATTTGDITQLTATGGYNSERLTWALPTNRANYRGVTIWRQEGNRSDAPPATLVATLGRSATSYLDGNLVVPSSGIWVYTVYTRDKTAGPIDPQQVSDWMTSAMSGRVTDAQGNGVGNVEVRVGYSAWSTGGETTTAADGTWLVDGLTDSSAVACFEPSAATGGISTTGYQSQCYRNVPSLPGYGPNGAAVALRVGVVSTGITATLQPGGTVAGVVRDAQGHPLANAGVTVQRSDGKVRKVLAVTGADGAYSVSGLAPGNYASCAYQPYSDLTISPASPTGYLGTCQDGSVDGTEPGYVPVAAGARVTADIVLTAAGAITGVLTGPGGAPVVGVQPQLGGTYSPGAALPLTDASGRYAVTGLRPGRYTICFAGSASSGSGASFDPGRSARCWKAADPASPTKIRVTLGQNVTGIDIKEPANPTVAGTVTDSGGHPLKNVYVQVDGLIKVGTDKSGSYRVGVAAGTHTVCFVATQAVGPAPSGYVDQCWHAQPVSGTPTPINVVRGAQVTGIDAALSVAAGVRVSVVDAQGTPLSHALVFLYHSGEGPNAITDAAGVATFTRVYQGNGNDYLVHLGDESYWNASPQAPHGYAPTDQAVTIRTGLVSVRVVAPAYGTLSGTVRGPDGQPVSGATVTPEGSTYLSSWTTGDDGTYSIPQVAPGTYTICAESWVGTGSDAHDATACWDGAATRDTATPIAVGDRAEVTGIDVVLQ